MTFDLVNPTCAQCGCDLHGLLLDGKCPECEFPVRVSLERPSLSKRSRTPDRAIRLAAFAFMASVVIPVLSPLLTLGAIGMTITSWIHLKRGKLQPDDRPFVYVATALCALSLAACSLVWWLIARW